MGRFLTILITASLLLLQPHSSFCKAEFTPELLYSIEGYAGTGPFQQIYSLHVDEDYERIIILNGAPLKISVFSLLDGAPLQDIVIFKEPKPPYSAFGCGRHIYFSHAGGMERFGEDGRSDKWKPPATFPQGADKVFCGPDGGVIFLLRGSNAIEKYSADGKRLFSIHPKDKERRKREEPELWSIADICPDAAGGLYAADARAGELHRYDAGGRYTGAIGGDRKLASEELEEIELLAADSYRNVWVYDGGDSRIKVFDSFGFFLGEWKATADDGTTAFVSPAALFVDRFDHLFLLDEATTKVSVFNVRELF